MSVSLIYLNRERDGLLGIKFIWFSSLCSLEETFHFTFYSLFVDTSKKTEFLKILSSCTLKVNEAEI